MGVTHELCLMLCLGYCVRFAQFELNFQRKCHRRTGKYAQIPSKTQYLTGQRNPQEARIHDFLTQPYLRGGDLRLLAGVEAGEESPLGLGRRRPLLVRAGHTTTAAAVNVLDAHVGAEHLRQT